MDFDQFMKRYFHFMGQHFAGWVEPNQLAKSILEATEHMIQVNDGRTNYAIFMDHFQTLVDGDIQAYEDHFSNYYETLFANVQPSTSVSPEMVEAVALLKDKGYTLVVATNPLFPYRANLHRLEWGGFDREDFIHITSLEDNTFCKPYPQFYQEVLDTIGKQPTECMMVGNDVFDDLPAGKLGIQTYLVTDHLLNPRNLPNTADHTGSYQDFLAFVKTLPSLN